VRVFRYAGSKGAIADCIIALMPPHKVYIEPFAGSASVFLKKQPSAVEVLNDINGDLMNFYRVCQCHPHELMRCLHFHLPSRQWFALWKNTGNQGLTDVMRAVKFFYLQMNAFGGQVIGQHFGTTKYRAPLFSNSRITGTIEGLHKRLERTYIEQLPYQEILRRYDGTDSLFYLDPPYFLKRRSYQVEFQWSDYVELKELLVALKGQFILSINDSERIRTLFSFFEIISKTVRYSSNQYGKTTRGAELIIHNLGDE
jgi:DNA adenine methylase